MELRHLAALVAVAEHGTFSAAADALDTVQSNVSAHVKRLEEELRATLVDRAGNQLTEEGEVVVARARRIQTELDALESDLAALHDVVRGTVRLGAIGTTARWLAPRLVQAVAERHPEVRLVVLEAGTSSLAPQLLGGRLALAVVNLPLTDPDLAVEQLFVEDLVLVAPNTHPLASLERVSVHDLVDHPLLLPPAGTSFRDDLDRAAAAAGVHIAALAELDGLRLIASMAFEGFGAGITPATGVPNWLRGDFRTIPIDGLRARRVGLARRARGLPSAATRAVDAVLREVVADYVGDHPGLHLLA